MNQSLWLQKILMALGVCLMLLFVSVGISHATCTQTACGSSCYYSSWPDCGGICDSSGTFSLCHQACDCLQGPTGSESCECR
jgi:hypothetical protein